MNVDDEPALVDASRRGDSGAFASLVARHQRMIHALTYRMTGSEADAADLAQDAFVQAWRRLESFRSEARFSSWLYRIAMNLCLNWRAREAREIRARQHWVETADAGAPPAGLSERRTAWVQEALLRLPAKQRAAVILTLYDGMKHAEAARVLGCSEATVSWRVFAAKTRLKRWISAFEKEERIRS